MRPEGFVLTYHSQNISGPTYATNDHVAFDESLALVQSLNIPVLRLLDVVTALRARTFSRLPSRFVCITFDDGPDYDWKPVNHPAQGIQIPMIDILRKHSSRFLGKWWLRKMFATSFVIASPQARKDISGSSAENPDRMSDEWWGPAQASGFMDIGTHGWNHVHPSVAEMKYSPELVEAFHKIDSRKQADLQIKTAAEYIREKAKGDAAKLFAYPYGQVSEYLVKEYLPAQSQILGAFTTVDRPLTFDCDIWQLPRYVCGWHWTSNEELGRLLAGTR